jgi:hypothetical protein
MNTRTETTELPPQGTCQETGPPAVIQYLLRARAGDYVGEGGTFNSSREYAKRFDSEKQARSYAKEHRMYTDFVAETA